MPSPRRATIADVAAASGVGVGTVSRVINGAPNVREATRTSVLKVIDQLAYRPSHLAASLSRGTARTMAIVVPHLTRPSVVMRLAGALAVLDEQGYDTVVCNVDTPQQRDHHLAALTRRHRADGVMVVSLRLSRQQLESFQRAGVPLVTVGVPAPGVPRRDPLLEPQGRKEVAEDRRDGAGDRGDDDHRKWHRKEQPGAEPGQHRDRQHDRGPCATANADVRARPRRTPRARRHASAAA